MTGCDPKRDAGRGAAAAFDPARPAGRAAAFPFSAIVGHDELREALLACAVDPAIGGVLIRGERGTAKTTAVRGLAPLLPPIRVREDDPFNADPDHADPDHEAPPRDGCAAPVIERPVRLVELPVGATADRVLGSLDLDRALAGGEAALKPGLLAAAHRGVLYVDEVNLLPDHLVDVLLDAAALGRNHVERDGLSVAHAARFLLVGTMNPEEGDLRPQLLDRFGLSVEVAGSEDPAVRVEIVRRRLAFDADPAAFAARFEADDRALAARVAAARNRDVRLPERMLLLIAGTCARLGVDGHRADIVCARAARALAALDGDDEVSRDHVRRAARLVLAHRRRRGPLQTPGLDERELDDALGDAEDAAGRDRHGDARGHDDAARRSDYDATGRGASNGDARGNRDGDVRGHDAADRGDHNRAGRSDRDAPGRGERRGDARGNGNAADRGDRDAADRGGPHGDARDNGNAAGRGDRDAADRGDRRGDARGNANAAVRGNLDATGRADRDGEARSDAGKRAYRAEAPSRLRTDAPDDAGPAPLLELAGARRRSAGQASPAADGVPVDSREPRGPVIDLALAPTLRAAAARRAIRPDGPRLHASDLREHVRAGNEGNLVVFCVDASGSMGTRGRMARVKGAILGLLTDAYQRRDRVALVAFRGNGADVILPPTGSVERAAQALATLPTGGATPLAEGLAEAERLIRAEARKAPERHALALVVTDGRTQRRQAAIEAVQRLAQAAGVVIFDGEQGPVRLGLAAALAHAADARLLPLEALA